METTFPAITFLIGSERFEVGSLWLRDEAARELRARRRAEAPLDGPTR